MAKKRSSKRVASRRGTASKKIPNPFNSFSFGNINWSEKSLFIGLLLVLSVVAFGSGSDMSAVTGAFAGVTGAGTTEDITTAVSDVWGIVDGLITPLFGIVGATGGEPNTLVIKLTLIIVLYLILNMGLKSMFDGKGSIIAGLISFLAIAFVPDSFITLYIGKLLPSIVTFILSFLIIFVVLYLIHKMYPETKWGHLLKGSLYAVALQLILILKTELQSVTEASLFAGISKWVFIALITYTIFKLLSELVKLGTSNKEMDLGKIGDAANKLGKGVDTVMGIPSNTKAAYREGRWGDKREVLAGIEEYVDGEKTNPSWAGMVGFLNKKLGTKGEKSILDKYGMTKKDFDKFKKKLDRAQKNPKIQSRNRKQDKNKAWG
jgi:hypothetical protein|tara:strand:- start:23063 stop:24193 length:1131 start_codon:yes stop_codon:yes gene_type:complete